jgi:hypothetical protein
MMKVLRTFLLHILVLTVMRAQALPQGDSQVSGTEKLSSENQMQGSGNYYFWKKWLASFYKSERVPGTNFVILESIQNAYDGGHNLYGSTGPYYDKTNWQPWQFNQYAHTPGQHDGAGIIVYGYSPGDTLPLSALGYCAGGENAGGDEGCEAADLEVAEINAEYAATISSGGESHATSLTLSPTAGSGTQGSGRFLIETTPAKTITNGSISAIQGSGPTAYTGVGTKWPISTVNTVLGTSVTFKPGSVPPLVTTVKPSSMTGISTSTLLCIGDAQNFEMLYPTSITGSTFSAIFQKPHSASAIVAAGGLCGYGIEIVADRSSQSNTLHWVWPVLRSNSATSLDAWISGQGNWQPYNGQWSAHANTYVLYPLAEVVSVQSGGTISNTFTLGPNDVPWANGDTVALPHYPAVHVGTGNFVATKYFPSPGSAAGGGPSITLAGLWAGQDTGFVIQNQTPLSAYSSVYGGSGVLVPPYGIQLAGNGFSTALRIDARANNIISYEDSTPNITQNLFRAIDNSGSAAYAIRYVRNASKAGSAKDYFIFGQGGLNEANDGEIATGGVNPVGLNSAFYLYYKNPAWAGLTISQSAGNPSGYLLATQVEGICRLCISNTNADVVNGVTVRGYSDNYGTQKWQITSSTGAFSASLYKSFKNCQLGGASGTITPASCGSAPAGMIAVPPSQTSYTVNTTAVTLNSEIFIQQMTDNSGLPSHPVCGSISASPMQSARLTSKSFTFTLISVPAVTCFKYWIVN